MENLGFDPGVMQDIDIDDVMAQPTPASSRPVGGTEGM